MGEQEQATASLDKAINWHHITVKQFAFKSILEIELTQEINHHADLFISGTLPETMEKDYVQSTDQYTPIDVTYTDVGGTEQFLFRGVVTDIKQRTLAGLTYLDIHASSYSYLLDVKKISRSFQREGEPYSYVFSRINTLARQYVPCLKDDVVKAAGNQDEQTTGRLIIQYQETDWQFLKRLASHFNIGLTPDITFDSPKVYFGLPPASTAESSKQVLHASKYQIKRDTAAYAKASSNSRQNSGLTFSENDFTYCDVQSLEMLKLGQQVTFLGLSWYVRTIHTLMDKGTVSNSYTLTTEKGLMQDDLYNYSLAGISLQGIIKAVVKDQVKVHITEIDESWDDGATWFYPYTTVYSSPDGSGFYSMPEIGDSVRINFPNRDEKDAVAASSINKTPSKRGQREDPDNKVLSTVYGKQVVLTPSSISIIANDNVSMTLTDDGGITINSDKKIIFKAKEDIEITSEQGKITLQAQEEIDMAQGSGANINMKDNIGLKGDKIKIQP